MWTNDTILKMYMDGEVRERVELARQGYELRRTKRLGDLIGALRRVQAELDIAERAVAARGRKLAPRGQ
jgi:hypothetical protein